MWESFVLARLALPTTKDNVLVIHTRDALLAQLVSQDIQERMEPPELLDHEESPEYPDVMTVMRTRR